MANRKIVLYVLAGAWNTVDTDGTGVLGVTENIDELKKKLEHIRKTKAKEYLENPYGDTEEVEAERFYEITDSTGGYAKFYISEHQVEMSESLIGALSCEMEMKMQKGVARNEEYVRRFE